MLKDKKVVIFGGTSGFGLATAKAAAAEGAEVIIISRSQERIENTLKLLSRNATGIVADVHQPENLKDLFESVGQFDHLVYTAGDPLAVANIEDITLGQAKAIFNVRYWGAFAAVKYGAPKLRSGGSINLIGGNAGSRPGAGWSVVASICAGMEGLTRALAVELAPIRVNLIAPGVAETNLWAGLSEQDRQGLYQWASGASLLKRTGQAEDVARGFIYLMGQPHVTGQVLTIDGGAFLL